MVRDIKDDVIPPRLLRSVNAQNLYLSFTVCKAPIYVSLLFVVVVLLAFLPFLRRPFLPRTEIRGFASKLGSVASAGNMSRSVSVGTQCTPRAVVEEESIVVLKLSYSDVEDNVDSDQQQQVGRCPRRRDASVCPSWRLP